MIAALTRSIPADSLLIMVGMPCSAPARRNAIREFILIVGCQIGHNLCLWIIASDGIMRRKR
jgi:hypothetical protein